MQTKYVRFATRTVGRYAVRLHKTQHISLDIQCEDVQLYQYRQVLQLSVHAK